MRIIDVDKQLVRLSKLNLDCEDVIREFLLTAESEYDLDGYSSRLWKLAYERGKQDAESKIVHCKDCKHNSLNRVSCNAYCDLGMTLFLPYDFCSKGERKTNE